MKPGLSRYYPPLLRHRGQGNFECEKAVFLQANAICRTFARSYAKFYEGRGLPDS